MYCCSFFQLSSRRATTSFMKASRSDWAEILVVEVSDSSVTARTAQDSLGITLNTLAETVSDALSCGSYWRVEFGAGTPLPAARAAIPGPTDLGVLWGAAA